MPKDVIRIGNVRGRHVVTTVHHSTPSCWSTTRPSGSRGGSHGSSGRSRRGRCNDPSVGRVPAHVRRVWAAAVASLAARVRAEFDVFGGNMPNRHAPRCGRDAGNWGRAEAEASGGGRVVTTNAADKRGIHLLLLLLLGVGG